MQPNWQRQLGRLRGWRDRAGLAPGLSGELDRLMAEADRQRQTTDRLAQALAEALPTELARAVVGASIARRRLELRTPDASSRYLLERWLRGGGEAALRRVAPSEIRRIAVVVGRG